LCAEKLTWHPLEQCVASLDDRKYVAFSTVCEPSSPANPEPDIAAAVDAIPFMLGGQRFLFRDLKDVARQRLLAMMQEYCQKLGPYLATRRFLITNIYMANQ
jgi:hypothetical protein